MSGWKRFPANGRRWFTWLVLILLVSTLFTPRARALTTEELLDQLQERAFDYFWNEASPTNGLVKDRSAVGSPGKMAATGFGMSAICIGIDHGWVTRAAGRERILTALNTLWAWPQGPEPDGNIGYQGLFYHFVDPVTALRTWDSDLSGIDTAILLAGIIDAKEYFATDDSLDVQLRALADSIYYRVDWNFIFDGFALMLAWTPEAGLSPVRWLGYNEAMLMYLLAIGSPTHPVPPYAWQTWLSGYKWRTYYGQSHVNFPPLFGHQYSHCWYDFRGIQDDYMRNRGIDYFENSRRATLAARSYCIDNPLGWTGYGENMWGLTASDDPDVGYIAHGAPPAEHDNGTITPTAAASSITFAPEIVIPALHAMYDTYGDSLWSTYGFKDAFNPTQNWYASDYIGIDQGPIIIMIENYRNQSVWNRFMRNEDVQRGLALAGFLPTIDAPSALPTAIALYQNAPNPFRGTTSISYRLPAEKAVTLHLYDIAGRRLRTLVEETSPAGFHEVTLSGEDLAPGVYFYRLEAGEERLERRCVLLP